MGIIPLRYGTVVDLEDGGSSRPIDSNSEQIQVFNISREFFRNRAANHALIKNKSDKLLFVKFDGSAEQIYPIDPGDNLVFNPIDNFTFTDIQILNSSGANSTGTVYVTVGWLYG